MTPVTPNKQDKFAIICLTNSIKVCIQFLPRHGSDRDKAALLRPRQIPGVCPGQHSAPARGCPDMLGFLEERLKVANRFFSFSFVCILFRVFLKVRGWKTGFGRILIFA